MKRLFTILLFIPFISNAQIEIKQTPKETVIGTAKSGSFKLAELKLLSIEGDSTFILVFSNQEYKTISDYQAISFKGMEAMASFYDVLKSFFLEEHKRDKDYKISLKLGDTDITLSTVRLVGTTSVMVWCKKGYFYLTEKQVDKLFNK